MVPPSWTTIGHRSRSPSGRGGNIPVMWRGGSRTSRSTVMCPCRRGMSSTPACFTVCGVTVRFDGRAASGAGTVGAGSATWSASTSGRPRPTPGRWPATEGDLVFAARPSAVATVVDRATRYAIVVARPDGYQADAVARMLIERMGQLPTHPRRSLTGDRGREMADHAVITAALSTPVFFCDPHHPWQRAENTIGCLRPAALRKSASGLRGFLRRAKYSAPVGRSGFPVARAQGWHAWASRTGDRSRHPPHWTTPADVPTGVPSGGNLSLTAQMLQLRCSYLNPASRDTLDRRARMFVRSKMSSADVHLASFAACRIRKPDPPACAERRRHEASGRTAVGARRSGGSPAAADSPWPRRSRSRPSPHNV